MSFFLVNASFSNYPFFKIIRSNRTLCNYINMLYLFIGSSSIFFICYFILLYVPRISCSLSLCGTCRSSLQHIYQTNFDQILQLPKEEIDQRCKKEFTFLESLAFNAMKSNTII